MGKQKQVISKELLEMITEKAATVATKKAVEVAINTYNQQKAIEEKEKFDRRLSNTRLLLEHYRDFSDYGDKAIYRIYEKLDEDVTDIVEMMEGRRYDKDTRIESIEKGVMRTKIIMNHVNTMLKVYKQGCDKSPNPEDRRRYRVIEGLYLKKVPESVQEIAEKEQIAERTVYKDVTTACKRLTALIFGIDGFQR